MSETVTKVNGIPLDLLIEIARLINGNPKLLEDMANGYAFGYEKGYKDAVKAVKEAVCREITKPIYDNAGTLPIPKIKFEPYKPPTDISALYRYNQSITAPKGIVVGIKTEKREEEDK